jgi:hypothetical protein
MSARSERRVGLSECSMLRRLIYASTIACLFAGPALAQGQEKPSIPLSYKPPPTQEEIEKQKAADKAYDAAIEKIPDKKASSDPWGNIRPESQPASKTKRQKAGTNNPQP